MKHILYTLLLTTCLLSGCTTSHYVVCISPQGQFNPTSESELLSELNNVLPFNISSQHFISKSKDSGLVGWAVVSNAREKDDAKACLENSTTLKLLQVDAMTPEFETWMKQQKR